MKIFCLQKIIYGTYVATPDSMCKQPSHAYSFHFIVSHTNYLCIPGCCDSFFSSCNIADCVNRRGWMVNWDGWGAEGNYLDTNSCAVPLICDID